MNNEQWPVGTPVQITLKQSLHYKNTGIITKSNSVVGNWVKVAMDNEFRTRIFHVSEIRKVEQ